MSDQSSPSNEQFSFVKTEETILEFWKKNKIFKKSLEKTKSNKPYIFYDGPPFATGLPHHGHLVGSILKDIVPRYATMNGRHVERRFGWDCHGLPIEHEIDKAHGKSAQDIVKEIGVAGYNKECRSIVQRYTSEWQKTIERVGRWVDFENDYKTMDLNFMESVWWVFSELYKKGLVYKGAKVVPFSTALGTVLSNFEAGLNYQEVQDPAVTVMFELSEEENTFILAWTTTPWTLPSNLGLCMGADIDYVKVYDSDLNKYLILCKDRLKIYGKKRNLEIVENFKGSDFLGKSYKPLFSYFSAFEKEGAFKIFNDDYVGVDNGTGVVHLAPSFGEDDNRVMSLANVNLTACPIDNQGKYTQEVSDYEGTYVKEADKPIIKRLKEEGKLFEQSVIVHKYPFCWRSDTPLLYRSIPSWYVKVEDFKEDLIEQNKKINWVPEHIKEGRFGKWLENARDWAISRNRYWGTPIPIFENEVSGKIKCVGSVSELEELTGKKFTDIHREFVDDLKFSLEGEDGEYKRIDEVFDCWFESGSMPYAQLHYPFENREIFESGFPAEYIAEGLDQTRGWFYTINILSTALFKSPAFKNVIVNGIVTAEDGRKMSKRLKNYTPPDELMDNFGADALRLYLINSHLVRAGDLKFSNEGLKDMVRRVLLPWYNAFKFFSTYAKIDNWNPKTDFKLGDNITDKWIVSRLQSLKKNIEREMESYLIYNVVPALFEFIEDLTNWYIRLNRSRFWSSGFENDKKEAFSTLYSVVREFSLIMAPFTPFLSEFIFLEFDKISKEEAESVHLCTYPKPVENLIKIDLESAVLKMQEVILLGRQKRNQAKIKVKTPLKRLTIVEKNEVILEEIKKLESYIKSELNIKEVVYDSVEENFVNLYARPNSQILGKKLGKDFVKFKKLIEALSFEEVKRIEKYGEITLLDQVFKSDEILIFKEAKKGTDTITNKLVAIELDLELSEELLLEGHAREVVNRIQRTRKELNFEVGDRVRIEFYGSEKIKSAIFNHSDYIRKETLANSIDENDKLDEESISSFSFDIDGEKLRMTIEKV